MAGWVQGEITAITHWTERLFSLQVAAEVRPFRAGQYNRLRLYVGDEWVARPYSYVNPPALRPLEFYLTSVPGGPLSNRLWQLQIGDTVELMPRASGLFTVDQVPAAEHLWLLATGTGLGPFLSILADALVWERFAQIRLVHAVRYVRELSYAEQIAQCARDHPGRLLYLPMVSREFLPGALHGRIPQALINGELEARAGLPLDAQTSQVMLCGNPDMVRDTQAVLAERGLRRNRRGEPGQVTVENYW